MKFKRRGFITPPISAKLTPRCTWYSDWWITCKEEHIFDEETAVIQSAITSFQSSSIYGCDFRGVLLKVNNREQYLLKQTKKIQKLKQISWFAQIKFLGYSQVWGEILRSTSRSNSNRLAIIRWGNRESHRHLLSSLNYYATNTLNVQLVQLSDFNFTQKQFWIIIWSLSSSARKIIFRKWHIDIQSVQKLGRALENATFTNLRIIRHKNEDTSARIPELIMSTLSQSQSVKDCLELFEYSKVDGDKWHDQDFLEQHWFNINSEPM